MIIYKATNTVNDKSYIGKTIHSLHLRKGQHLRSNETTHFHRALRKYGKDMFDWSVIKETKTEKELDNQEIKFIKEYDTYKNGYNSTIGGDNGTYVMSEEHKKNLSKSHLGKRFSKEHRKNLSKSHMGLKHGAIALANYKKEHGYWNVGISCKEETKDKIRETLQNKPLLTCEVCGFTSNSKGNMRRWHGEKCRT